MKCSVRFTETAKGDLRNIAFYIADQSKDTSVAINFVSEIREKCNILEQFPESGSIPNDRVLMSSGYCFLVHKDYLIFYLYSKKDSTVYVLAVFNSKQYYTRVMKRFL